jgi:thiol-disulfide isomerase/thioredoxin
MKRTVMIAILISLFFTTARAQNPVKTMPAFIFFKLNKAPYSNKNVDHGKKVFFIFFDSECGHCQDAARNLNSNYLKFRDAAICMVTLDDRNKINHFMSTYCPNLLKKRNVKILQDINNEFIAKFNPRKYPSMLLYSSKGTLLAYEDEPESMDKIIQRL